ncbi:MAG: N(G),N(G)-dimethylarginine dimethylaminohydrolase [Acidobacteriota bacterium]|nr:N(G),N(G)-dimethylarginine dimethylaminohydrolase [Acidobacteriota bacterium]
MFHRAIVRGPSMNFGEGLTGASLGAPDYARAVEQHDAYCVALEECGLVLTPLEPDPRYPDSAFIEDTAVLVNESVDESEVITKQRAVLTRPGAVSRTGEVARVQEVLSEFCSELHSIREPGTVDGGDICQAGAHFFIGISERTNEAGAQQLAELIGLFGHTSTFIDIRARNTKQSVPNVSASPGILHLKSGLACLGDNHLVVIESLARRQEFRDFDLIRVDAGEEYAANCVRINEYVLVAAGYRAFEEKLRKLGYKTIALEMTEFQKMDGGLSCLSLRF